MADEPQPKPGPEQPQRSSQSDGGKEASPAQPQQAGAQEGVQVGGLNYTENEDGTRNYPDQKPVQTNDNPTPTPEAPAPEQSS